MLPNGLVNHFYGPQKHFLRHCVSLLSLDRQINEQLVGQSSYYCHIWLPIICQISDV